MAKESSRNAVFQIPERYQPGLEKLVILEDEVIEKLLKVVQGSPPTFYAEDIASLAHKDYGIEIEDASDIIRSIISLYSLRETEYFSTEELTEEVSKALRDESSFPDEALIRFQKRLTNFLEISGSLEISSKASDLRFEHENIFSNARVLTDIRPIFKPDTTEGIGGALIAHVLRIGYKNISGLQEFFVALDSSDVEQLFDQLERAMEKEEVIKKLLEKTDIPHLDIYPKSIIEGDADADT